jgi:hypothetical protein
MRRSNELSNLFPVFKERNVSIETWESPTESLLCNNHGIQQSPAAHDKRLRSITDRQEYHLGIWVSLKKILINVACRISQRGGIAILFHQIQEVIRCIFFLVKALPILPNDGHRQKG